MNKKKALIFILLISLVLSTSCSLVVEEARSVISQNNGDGERTPDDQYLTPHNLVQRLVDSIRSQSDVEELFRSIPESQRDSLTLDEYQQYIQLLRRGIPGEINSFSMMNEQDLQPIQSEMIQGLSDNEALVESMLGVWLYYHELGRREEKFALYIAKPETEPAHLSAVWVRRILALSDFATLYFDAIERGDETALAVLLRDDELDLPHDHLVIKAQRIIEFYQNNVSSRTSEFRLTQARVDCLGFEAFGITNPDQTQAVSREIKLMAASPDRFYIDDIIPDILDSRDLHVFFEEQLLFEFAGVENEQLIPVRSSHFESVVGAPRRHDDTNCETIGNLQHFRLQYESMTIEVEGTCFRHSRWDGIIKSVILHDSDSRLGSGLRPGHGLEDVISRYPFAAETDFELTGRFDGGLVSLQIKMSDGIVEQIKLDLVRR